MQIIHHYGCVMSSHDQLPILQCVSFCGKMGCGAARAIDTVYHIRDQFKLTPRLCPGIVPIQRGRRLIVNIITKQDFFVKPTPEQVFSALQILRQFLMYHNIREVATTVLSCGKDKLPYPLLIKFLTEIFNEDPLVFHMYHM